MSGSLSARPLYCCPVECIPRRILLFPPSHLTCEKSQLQHSRITSYAAYLLYSWWETFLLRYIRMSNRKFRHQTWTEVEQNEALRNLSSWMTQRRLRMTGLFPVTWAVLLCAVGRGCCHKRRLLCLLKCPGGGSLHLSVMGAQHQPRTAPRLPLANRVVSEPSPSLPNRQRDRLPSWQCRQWTVPFHGRESVTTMVGGDWI